MQWRLSESDYALLQSIVTDLAGESAEGPWVASHAAVIKGSAFYENALLSQSATEMSTAAAAARMRLIWVDIDYSAVIQ